MKKVAIRCVFLAIFLLFLPLRAAAAQEGEAPVAPAEIEQQFSAFCEGLPPEVRDLLPETLKSGNITGVEETLREEGGIRAVLSAVGRITGLTLLQALSLLARIVGLLLLYAVFRALSPEKSSGLARALSLCSTLSLALLLFALQGDTLQSLESFFDTVQGFSATMLPLMGSLYAMGGNVRVAVVNHGIFSAFLSILQVFYAGSATGIAGVCLALALLDAVASGISLRPLAGLIKRSYTLLLSFLMVLLCGVLGVQSTLAKAGDSLALRTARFAAGSFLPVVGGSVSESLRTVAASVEYLRSVVGSVGITVLFFAFLPPFFNVLLTRLSFLLGGSVAKLLCCEGAEKLLSEMASVYGYFLAVIASLFVMLVFSLTLFAHCAAG